MDIQLDENEERPKTTFFMFSSALAGGMSGGITRALAQPLDVLKIRFQLQLEPIRKGVESKYKSIPQAVFTIVKEEGLTTLWSGHIPAQLLSVTYGIIQFSIFDSLTELTKSTDQNFYEANQASINFTHGAIAATAATIVSFPFDTVRTRLIAEQKTRKAYRGFSHAFQTMVHTEGVRSLYKGLLPTLAQIAPYAGIQFAVYKLFSEHAFNKIGIFQREGSKESNLQGNFVAGSISGFVSKTLIYPFDLVKKRLQIQGFQQYRTGFGKQIYCKGLLHCVKLTIMEEGMLALYKGYWPSTLKAILVSALHFSVYDEIKHYLEKL